MSSDSGCTLWPFTIKSDRGRDGPVTILTVKPGLPIQIMNQSESSRANICCPEEFEVWLNEVVWKHRMTLGFSRKWEITLFVLAVCTGNTALLPVPESK